MEKLINVVMKSTIDYLSLTNFDKLNELMGIEQWERVEIGNNDQLLSYYRRYESEIAGDNSTN